ncbi:hypothetical protein [Ralstonia insidiosa]|nr:hypothetical protein [Ralstonia insidiosa]
MNNQVHGGEFADSEGGIDVAESGFDPSEFSDSPEPVAATGE